jgi:hypothetical protein
MKYIFFLLAISFLQELPYKPKEEFDIKLDYQFRQRPSADNKSTVVMLDESQKEKERRTSSAILPYLSLSIKVLTALPATKARISSNLSQSISTRKVKEGTIIPLEVGFTDDVKDRVTAHQYFITFVGDDRTELSRIVIFIDEDGTFMVNGEKRGRF